MKCAVLALAIGGCTTWNPPVRFDHAFTGPVEIQRLAPRDVGAACAGMFAWAGLDVATTDRQKGCAVEVSGVCYIITVDRLAYSVIPRSVIRHEMGHCNGWPADHPEAG